MTLNSFTLCLGSEDICETMKNLDPEGFQKQHLSAKKVIWTQLTSLGPNDEWCGDGHDKLNKIGIGIYGICDKFSGFWLRLWAVSNNRLGDVVAHLYLCLVEKKGLNSYSVFFISSSSSSPAFSPLPSPQYLAAYNVSKLPHECLFSFLQYCPGINLLCGGLWLSSS